MGERESVNVFVNGISAKSGGGASILRNFLASARKANDRFRYLVAVPDSSKFADLASPRISLVSVGWWSRSQMIPLSSALMLPRLAQRRGCDLIFTLADIPVMSRRPQVFLFDWPYAAFPQSPAWRLGSLGERLARWVKVATFRALLPFVDCMIAQSAPLAQRLRKIYGLRNIDVVPNAVSLENLDGGRPREFGLGSGFKLLCLSRYYSHKNIEIFLPVARRIRDAKLDAKIIVTLSRDENDRARWFLDAIDSERLSDIVINVGPVPMAEVPSLYQQTDALLLPTLLESFSGTYVEAMYHRRPILTSDMPFARGVCGDAAFYFDPTDDMAILETIRKVMAKPEMRADKVNRGEELLAEMPGWEEAYLLYTRAFKILIDARS